jgi:hypothetical protein
MIAPMRTSRLGLAAGAVLATIVVATIGIARAQSDAKPIVAPGPSLSALDYAEIEQLSARYAFAIDHCTNGGYDYANLFVADGEFAVADAWDVEPQQRRFRATGRDALAIAAGGGPDGCRDPKTLMGYGISHIIVNHVITATPDGAVGKSYLLAIGVGGVPTQIELQGGYEDVYVKTTEGWRFRSRIHVFPNIGQSVQFGSGRAQ